MSWGGGGRIFKNAVKIIFIRFIGGENVNGNLSSRLPGSPVSCIPTRPSSENLDDNGGTALAAFCRRAPGRTVRWRSVKV